MGSNLESSPLWYKGRLYIMGSQVSLRAWDCVPTRGASLRAAIVSL